MGHLDLRHLMKAYLDKKDLIKDHFHNLHGDTDGVGYLLDPKYASEKMDLNLRHELENFSVEYSIKSDESEEDIENLKVCCDNRNYYSNAILSGSRQIKV
uniref:Uncharacterized protein n=1 Tax=Romanomermis culicivorax TaxID=13658 RepID=A0A915ILH3_ROMCU